VSEETLAYICSGPFRSDRPGYDGVVWLWYIGAQKLEVRVSETALVAHPGGVSERAENAINSCGESEVVTFLGWKALPDWIEFSTDNLPWIEGGEFE
jgi:hypothetical protein